MEPWRKLAIQLELYQRVIVNRDVPEENVQQGDLAWLVDYVNDPEGDEAGAVLEVFHVLGESIAIATVPVSSIGRLRPEFVPSARKVGSNRSEN